LITVLRILFMEDLESPFDPTKRDVTNGTSRKSRKVSVIAFLLVFALLKILQKIHRNFLFFLVPTVYS